VEVDFRKELFLSTITMSTPSRAMITNASATAGGRLVLEVVPTIITKGRAFNQNSA
jgi:hypothetical protein